jgi:hypothetical protein
VNSFPRPPSWYCRASLGTDGRVPARQRQHSTNVGVASDREVKPGGPAGAAGRRLRTTGSHDHGTRLTCSNEENYIAAYPRLIAIVRSLRRKKSTNTTLCKSGIRAYIDDVAMCPPFRRSSGFSGVSMPPSRAGQLRKIRSIEVR